MRAILPFVAGVFVTFIIARYLVDWETLRSGSWMHPSTGWWIAAAVAMIGLRAAGYVYRLHHLAGGRLSWARSTQVIFLWEFSSAVTPGTVGGAAVAILLLARERFSSGRAAAMVLVATLLDMLYLVFLVPIFLVVLGSDLFFTATACVGAQMAGGLQSGALGLVILILGLLVVFSGLMIYGLFIDAGFTRRAARSMGRWPVLRRWQDGFDRFGDDVMRAAESFRGQTVGFWARVSAGTILSWTARFALALFLIKAVHPDFADVALGYGRQLVILVIMMLPVTPGGVGVAEGSMVTYLCDLMPRDVLGVMLIMWRMLTYYIYLLVGMVVLPRWVTRVFRNRSESNTFE